MKWFNDDGIAIFAVLLIVGFVLFAAIYNPGVLLLIGVLGLMLAVPVLLFSRLASWWRKTS